MTERIPKVVILGPAYVEMAVKCDTFPEAGQFKEDPDLPAPDRRRREPAVQRPVRCEVFLLARVGKTALGR